jgi:hypothetical protein
MLDTIIPNFPSNYIEIFVMSKEYYSDFPEYF